jgi:hypothetical protein
LGQAQQQPAERVYNLSHTATPKDFEALTKLVVSVTKVGEVSANEAQRMLTVQGNAGQIALSDWLVKELDRTAPSNPAAQPAEDNAVHQYSVGDNDVVRVLYFPLVDSIAGFQNVITMIRSVADIANALAYNPLRAFAVRGTNDQVTTAAWMTQQMNQAIQTGVMSTDEYRMSGVVDNVVRLYLAKPSDSIQTLAEIVTDIRSIGDIRRLFMAWAPDFAPRIVALRGTIDQIALADWLFHQLDQVSPGGQGSASVTYQMSDGAPENVVRIFYLPNIATVQEFQSMAKKIRTETRIRRLFTYNAPRAVIVRGTASETSRAAELVQAANATASNRVN